MRVHEPRKVKIAGSVTADHKEILCAIEIGAVFYAARRAQRLALYAVFKAYAERRAVAEIIHYVLRTVLHRRADLVKAVLFEQTQNVLQHRPPEKRDHGLWQRPGYALEPPTLAARHYDRLHIIVSFPAPAGKRSNAIIPAQNRIIYVVKYAEL